MTAGQIIVLIIFGVVCPTETGAQAEVGQFYVAVTVYQNVVRFNIPMDEADFVDALDSTNKLGDIEPEIFVSVKRIFI